MKQIALLLFIHLSVICMGQKSNAPLSKTNYLPYKTIRLSEGYKLTFETNDELRAVRLTGGSIDTILYTRKKNVSERDFGCLMADYTQYFVIYYGSDVDRPWLRIYKKDSGALILTGLNAEIDSINHTFYAVSVDEKKNLCLFDGNSGKLEYFSPPKTPCLWWFECIISKKLTEKDLTIEYATYGNKRETKVYQRK